MNIHKYTTIIKAITLVVLMFSSIQFTLAQDENDVKWFEDKDEAFEAAKKENKNVLLLWGHDGCSNCRTAKLYIKEEQSLRKHIDESFILWFCDSNKSSQADNYVGQYQFEYLPLICIIDPNDPELPLSYLTGKPTISDIENRLKNNLPEFNDPSWYRNKEQAFATAKKENKYVLLLYGRNTCTNCRAAKEFINTTSINNITDKSFILWFCDVDLDSYSIEYYQKAKAEKGSVIFPLLCVIDPYKPIPALAYTTNYVNQEQIENLLNGNLPTANEEIYSTPSSAFITNNNLTVSNTIANEIIYIYTINGQLIDSFEKTNNIIIRSASTYPKGVLLVSSSQGWNMKLSNR